MDQHEIDRRVALADDMHNRNFNCAQCVALACADLVGLDEKTAFKMLEGFGAGMGGLTQTCGAISGAVAVVSYPSSDGPDNPTTKSATYKQVRRVVSEFEEQVGSTLCNQIKGLVGGEMLLSCPDCIALGVRLALAALQRAEVVE